MFRILLSRSNYSHVNLRCLCHAVMPVAFSVTCEPISVLVSVVISDAALSGQQQMAAWGSIKGLSLVPRKAAYVMQFVCVVCNESGSRVCPAGATGNRNVLLYWFQLASAIRWRTLSHKTSCGQNYILRTNWNALKSREVSASFCGSHRRCDALGQISLSMQNKGSGIRMLTSAARKDDCSILWIS
jgi:hypothetical protein